MFEKIKTYFKSGGDSINWVFGGKTSKTDFRWTDSKAMNYYEISLYANRAINKRADKVGETEFKLMKGEVEVENEWSELLRRPNNLYTGVQFWKLYQKYKDIFGEAYILKEQPEREGVFNKKEVPSSLQLLRPDLVEKKYNADKTEIIGFTYNPENGVKTPYEPEEIIYSFNPDPRRPYEGESLLRSGMRILEIETQADEYQANSIKSGGSNNTVIKIKDAVNPEQIKETREAYRKLKDEAWSEGRPNEPLFAGGDMDVLRMSLTPTELAYIDSKKMTLEEVSILTNTPRDILGLTSGSTYANADAAIRIFLRETIKPLVEELADTLNWGLIPDEFELIAVDPTPEDMEEIRKNVETGNTTHSLTINEKRELLGLDPIDKGDVILVPFNLTPYGEEREEKPREEAKTKAKGHILRNSIKRREFGENYIKKLERRKEAVDKTVRQIFKDQEERITSYLSKALKSKSIIDDSFNMQLEINIAKNTLLPIIIELFKEQGQEHLVFLGSNERFNYTSTMDSTLSKRADIFAQSINQTTFDKLKREFAESISQGETRKELVSRIKETYSDISKGRAEVIARTETHYALQTATLDAVRQSGIDLKIWVWAEGVMGGVREDHLSIDGEEREVERPFSNGLMFPGDGGPEDSINCQCTLA